MIKQEYNQWLDSECEKIENILFPDDKVSDTNFTFDKNKKNGSIKPKSNFFLS